MKKARIQAGLLPTEKRVRSFDEGELSLNSGQAMAESRRCLKCDLRLNICQPILPPRKKLDVHK